MRARRIPYIILAERSSIQRKGISNQKSVFGTNIRDTKAASLPLALLHNVDLEIGSPQIYTERIHPKRMTGKLNSLFQQYDIEHVFKKQ